MWVVVSSADRWRSTYLNARRGEVRDLELDLDGGLAFRFLADDAGQSKVCPHQVFLTTLWKGMLELVGHYGEILLQGFAFPLRKKTTDDKKPLNQVT